MGSLDDTNRQEEGIVSVISDTVMKLRRNRRDGKKDSSNSPYARIKELLTEWAAWHKDGYGIGYPSQAAFAIVRVQCEQGGLDQRKMPDEVKRVNEEIERFAPGLKRVIKAEFFDKLPVKTKAAKLGISREAYYDRLRFMYEQLSFVIFGEVIEGAA